MALPILLLYIGSVLVAHFTIRKKTEIQEDDERPEDGLDEENH
jgi:Sec-independent protein secretion pathway component TatC